METGQIQKRIAMLEKAAKEIRDAREMLKEELENDPVYVEAVKEANEANSKKKRIKEEIMNRGANKKLIDEIKENNEEISTLKEILSAELVQIYEEDKIDEVTDQYGEVRKFQVLAKLLPKKGNFQRRDNDGKYTESS